MELDRKPTQQDITWFLDLHRAEKLDLNPRFQRKSVWNKRDREFFIDTVLNNFPCPAVFLYKDVNQEGNAIYRVIDGKQRLKSVIDYSQDQFRTATEDNQNADIRGKLFSDLNAAYKKAFWNFSFPVELVNTDSDEAIKSIFDRLNRNNKTLKPQELRNAKYDGHFRTFIEKEVEDDFWVTMVRFTKNDISRMTDQQFLAELVLLVLMSGPQGFDQDSLDELYAERDEDFEEEAFVRERLDKIKQYIRGADEIARTIQQKFSTRSLFYSLFSVLNSLHEKLPSPKDLNDRLLAFSGELNKLEGTVADENIHNFASNNRGATTDLRQRKGRHDSLMAFLLAK